MTTIATTITTQCNLNTANTTYRLTGNTVVSNVAAPFNVTAGGIIFEGSGFTITVNNTPNFRGLFNASLTVRNVDIVSAGTTTLSQAVDGVSPPLGAGAVFNANVVGGIASNCRNYIPVLHCCGGIFGTGCSNGTATNCSNFGSGSRTSGGIFAYNSSNCIASNCTNTSVTTGEGGGIFADQASNCGAINCVSSDNSVTGIYGGMFGRSASNSYASNCTNLEGSFIKDYGGGVFGFNMSNCRATNCINRATVSGADYGGDGIMAGTNYVNFVSNCYNTGVVRGLNNYAISRGGLLSNCYTTNGAIGGTPVNCSSNTNGVWNDATATASRNGGNGLTGTPFYNPDATTSAIFPSVGSVWYSTGINTPFLLSATIPPCFVAGTRILTPTGYSCVETLKDHDEVVTSDGRTVSIKVYKTTIETTDEDTAPYVIPKDAFGLNNPNEDLHVSGKHIIQDGRGVWQAPKYLSCARQYGVGSPMTYYHIECPDYFHDDLVANGAVVESFRNKQGTSQVSYEYSEKLWGYVRVMPLETGFADKHVLNDTACC